MTEIIFIICQLFIFLIIFSYPINVFKYSKIIFPNNLGIYYVYSLNIIIHLNIYLIISFLPINIEYFYYLEIILLIIFIFFYRFWYLNIIKKAKYEKIKYFLFFVLVNLILFLAIAEEARLSWDGLAHWIFKARIFFDGGNYFDFKDNIPFPYYPHLGSFTWGYFWKNSYLEYEYFGRLIFPLIYLISIFTISSNYKKNQYYLIKILITLFLILISLDFYLFGGYQEYLLFFLFSILGLISFHFFEENKKLLSLLFMILILNLIIWSKQEGFFYSIIFAVTLCIFTYKDTKFSLTFFISLLFLTIIHIYLKSFVIDENMFNEKIFNNGIVNYINLKILFNDLLLISKHMIISSFKYPIILIVTVLLILFIPTIKNSRDYFFYSIFLLNLLFIVSIYLQTNMNLEDVLPVTIDRVMFQSSGFYLVYLINKLSKNYNL